MLIGLGWKIREIWGDASAALGIINGRGLGKTRHIEIGHLWVQEVTARDRLKFKNVLGKDDPADLYIKYQNEKSCGHHIETLSYRFQGGRADEVPQMHALNQSLVECNDGDNFLECEWVSTVIDTISRAWDQQQKAYSANTRGGCENQEGKCSTKSYDGLQATVNSHQAGNENSCTTRSVVNNHRPDGQRTFSAELRRQQTYWAFKLRQLVEQRRRT